MLDDVSLALALERFLANGQTCITRYECPDGMRRGLKGTITAYTDRNVTVQRPKGEIVELPLRCVLEIVTPREPRQRTPGSRRDWHGP
ncbi:MAG: hypothetical protein GXX95_00860 [Methanomassiliicoccus sp.]|nr:hypothetical protein [Methanomassiliicoccus sp.]